MRNPLTPHAEYLLSPHWRKTRIRILERDKRRCRRCGGGAVEVHHRRYDADVLNGRADDGLASVCVGCRNVIDTDDDGNKRTADQREDVLLRSTPATDYPAPVANLNRVKTATQPPGWDRMTSVQCAGWTTAALAMGLAVDVTAPRDGSSRGSGRRRP